ncbi:MAG: sulfur-carrier protein adenylyltransferase/sulfurtransferase, partial [Gemmatimonadaceae bacterium]|nr:sulfur-carrier protein adenylyltransferase/sulfurtransferase [Gemmatimonadaceae bacterium]
FGEEGQEKLKRGSALIVGAGGLGSPVAIYLAAAGVGRIGLVDFDRVDFTNLHRQILYGMSDVDRPKLEAATDRLRDINSLAMIEPHETALTSDNALEILENYDVVIDGTDNFPTRYLVNDACVFLDKPNVYGSIFRFEGQASVFYARKGPCYRCLYPEPPPPNLVPSCAEGGVLGVLPGVIGTIQATEAIKLLAGIGEPLIGRLTVFDALSMSFRQLRLKKNDDCVVCGKNPTVTELIDYEGFCNPALVHETETSEIPDGSFVIDVREPHEWNAGHIEGARLIPMRSLPQELGSIPRDRDIVLYCQHGQRSAYALEFLRAQGFTRARHLEGGYATWLRTRR